MTRPCLLLAVASAVGLFCPQTMAEANRRLDGYYGIWFALVAFTAFNWHPGGNVDKRTNLYLLKTGDMGQTWKTAAGETVATPLSQPDNAALVRDLTKNSPRNHSYARRPANAKDDFYALWADGDADRFSESFLYFCTKRGEVYQLPQKMSGATAKPAAYPPGQPVAAELRR